MRKILKIVTFTLISTLCALTFACCAQKIDLKDYVSEYRMTIFTAETTTIALRADYTLRENPFLADGIKRDCTPVIEITVQTENTGEKISISFVTDAKTHGGEMNYDSVKKCFTYSESVTIDNPPTIDFVLTVGKEEVTLSAENRRTADCLSEEAILEKLVERKGQLIDSLTSNGTFRGEIGIRFIDDEGTYFFVGVTDTDKKTTALLLNATSGDTIAEKQLDN